MNAKLEQWVAECAALLEPASIYWCDGSEEENQRLIGQMVEAGTFEPLNQDAYPGCYLARSHPSDVARVEDRTYICTTEKDDAGPTNNWLAPAEAKETLSALYKGAMRGRTMYVIPYVMGPLGAEISKVGVEITDSPYVVVNMRIMTRMGKAALEQLGEDGEFVKGLHSIGAPLEPGQQDVAWPCNTTKYICHFPEERLILSYGSGYGGNALLGKKCFSLRIASAQARDEGWMAEHMLILEMEDPQGDKTYWAAAFPSACGKTNLAMLISPLEEQGWKVKTLGDDIAWLRVGEDGRLWALNPEAGFFGVVPGTNMKTNPNAIITSQKNTIYTNVAVSEDAIPWWEGKGEDAPEVLTDWKGNKPWDGAAPAAHPNSRFTAPASQCPVMSDKWQDPAGVPLSGIIFGGRRSSKMPLVMQAYDWNHGVFLGATMASETTAAAIGQSGVLRRDPMAMLPFIGYNVGDYLAHWISMGKKLSNPPAIFHVNWFRKSAEGKFLWPGFGENVRPLIWMRERIAGVAAGRETPIGIVATPDALHLENLEVDSSDLEQILTVDAAEWTEEIADLEAHLAKLGKRVPCELQEQLDLLEKRLNS